DRGPQCKPALSTQSEGCTLNEKHYASFTWSVAAQVVVQETQDRGLAVQQRVVVVCSLQDLELDVVADHAQFLGEGDVGRRGDAVVGGADQQEDRRGAAARAGCGLPQQLRPPPRCWGGPREEGWLSQVDLVGAVGDDQRRVVDAGG